PAGFPGFPPDATVTTGDRDYTPTPRSAALAGTYSWTASYAGDGNNFAAIDDGGDETTVVGKAQPHISTTASADGVVGVVTMSDTAHLTGGYTPGGTIHFVLSGPAGFAGYTQDVTVTSGDGDYSTTPFTATIAGTYTWTASYAGDGNNFAAIDDGGDETT